MALIGAAVYLLPASKARGNNKRPIGPVEFYMSDLIQRLRFDDMVYLLKSGHPPIYIQLLCLIVLLVIINIYRKLNRQKLLKHRGSLTLQWLLIVTCFAVIIEDQWLPILQSNFLRGTDQIMQVLRL